MFHHYPVTINGATYTVAVNHDTGSWLTAYDEVIASHRGVRGLAAYILDHAQDLTPRGTEHLMDMVSIEAASSALIENEPGHAGMVHGFLHNWTNGVARYPISEDERIAVALVAAFTRVQDSAPVSPTALHQYVMGGHPDIAGETRDSFVTVGKKGRVIPPDPVTVPGLLTRWTDADREFLAPASVADPTLSVPSLALVLGRMIMSHAEFEAIHPFADGNGRTGRVLFAQSLTRLLTQTHPVSKNLLEEIITRSSDDPEFANAYAAEMMRNGGATSVCVPVSEGLLHRREWYFDGLSQFTASNDPTPFLDVMVDAITHGLNKTLEDGATTRKRKP